MDSYHNNSCPKYVNFVAANSGLKYSFAYYLGTGLIQSIPSGSQYLFKLHVNQNKIITITGIAYFLNSMKT